MTFFLRSGGLNLILVLKALEVQLKLVDSQNHWILAHTTVDLGHLGGW